MASSGNYSDSARRFLWDVSGAFGDIGVLIPLSAALIAHSKFGATSRRSGYIIGCALIACALFLGRPAAAVVSAFPRGILGVLLCFVGLQHALFVKDVLSDGKGVFVAFLTGALGFAFGNLTAGFLAGLAMHYGWSGIRKIARA